MTSNRYLQLKFKNIDIVWQDLFLFQDILACLTFDFVQNALFGWATVLMSR